VSWFDAALYCNAKSRAEGLDTVYVYSALKASVGGSVYELMGLRCDFSRQGYRLPTEAEWEFAAREASSALPFSAPTDTLRAGYTAWYFANASGKTHPVSTKQPSALGLYDMAGNVFEWTNDWKGAYNGKNITDALGALQPDGEYEKVIKGGGYDFGVSYLRPSHRSATYATTLSSANEYVGFRCARGALQRGHYFGAEQRNFISNPVTVSAGSSTVRAFTGAFESKLVFVNVTGQDRTLCCIDFSAALPYVREFNDDTSVYMPTVSPDGRFAAYCSGNEGQSGRSKITLRSLDSLFSPLVRLAADTAYIPRWWVNRSSADTCIVYTNSALLNGSPLWKSTRTYVQKVSGGRPIGNPEILIADGSYHDGISVDKQYAVTGYNRLMMRNLITNEEKELFLSPRNGKDASGSTQVCNVSLSPGDEIPPRCLFLDFGYPMISSVTGCAYGVHQYLFVSSFADTITDCIPCPEGEASWDHPEWSNQPRFATANCRNSADQAHALHMIDLKSHSYKPLAQGTELQQPWLWIGKIVENPFNLALDSLGCYDEPHIASDQGSMALKLHIFWNNSTDIDLAFLGTSLVYCGVDCGVFKYFKAINMGYTGCGIYSTATLVSNYLLHRAPKLKLIGINIPFYLFAEPLGDPGGPYFSNTIGQSKGYLYDKSHDFWQDSLPAGFLEYMAQISDKQEIETNTWDSLGYLFRPCNGWGGPNPDLYGPASWTIDDTTFKANFAAFVAFIDEVSAHDIHVLAINFPESPYYKSTNHYLRAGPSWETGRAVLEQVKALEKTHPYFHVYDAYKDGNHDYTDEDAFDYNHLCQTGAKKLTQRLDSLIQKILSHSR
jgi:uncharacterized protein (TIGR02171 family)